MITKDILEKERFLLTIIRLVKYETEVEGTPWSLNVYKVDNEETDFDIIISPDHSFVMLLLGEIGIVARFIDNNAVQRLVLRNKNLFPEIFQSNSINFLFYSLLYNVLWGYRCK